MSQQLPTPASPKAAEEQDGGLGDSWVAYSLEADGDQRSMAMKEMERLLREAQRESGNSSLAGSSKAGSSLPSTPCNSVQSTPVESGQASPKNSPAEDSLSAGSDVPKTMEKSTDTDWVWDWSSTPGARPPKNAQYKRPVRRSVTLSLRKSSAMKSGFFSWDFLQVFIPSLILTNLVAFGLGVYVGKRLTTDRSA